MEGKNGMNRYGMVWYGRYGCMYMWMTVCIRFVRDIELQSDDGMSE